MIQKYSLLKKWNEVLEETNTFTTNTKHSMI